MDVPYRLKRRESVSDGIVRIAREQFRCVDRELRASHRPEVIHRARKRLKMLRAVLRLVRSALSREDFDRENRNLRDIGRTLSRLRDADVLVDVIDELRLSDTKDAAVGQIAARARQHRQQVRREFAKANTVAETRRVIRAADARLGQWATGAIDRDAILEGLRLSFKRAQTSGAAAGRGRDDDRWHEWRKRTKDLWYHLRLVRSVWPAMFEGAIAQCKALADQLGDDHDLVVVGDRVREFAVDPRVARKLARFRGTIERRRREIRQQAREDSRCWLVGKPRGFRARMLACWRVWRD